VDSRGGTATNTREDFIDCVRDASDGNPAGILVSRAMIIAGERYIRSDHKHLPIFYGTYSATPFGGVVVKVNEYALYTAARTVISVLVQVCGYDALTDKYDIKVLKGDNVISGVVLGDLTRISITKGTNVVVHAGQSNAYAGVICGKGMNASREWEVDCTPGGPRRVPESEISYPENYDHGLHRNRTVNGFGSGGFENTDDIAICDQLPGVMHKDDPKEFVLSPYVLNLPAVRAYYAVRQEILLRRLNEPPAVWIGGDEVSDYMSDFFSKRPVLQTGDHVHTSTGGQVLGYGLSEYVLRADDSHIVWFAQLAPFICPIRTYTRGFRTTSERYRYLESVHDIFNRHWEVYRRIHPEEGD